MTLRTGRSSSSPRTSKSMARSCRSRRRCRPCQHGFATGPSRRFQQRLMISSARCAKRGSRRALPALAPRPAAVARPVVAARPAVAAWRRIIFTCRWTRIRRRRHRLRRRYSVHTMRRRSKSRPCYFLSLIIPLAARTQRGRCSRPTHREVTLPDAPTTALMGAIHSMPGGSACGGRVRELGAPSRGACPRCWSVGRTWREPQCEAAARLT
mmetsp:Transcript_20778/g.58504  ORF Transcript_20778/g.58504 Transcript_20778/m.58504 type:complete len:211 (+) Transcript_20778:551-1183(+)